MWLSNAQLYLLLLQANRSKAWGKLGVISAWSVWLASVAFSSFWNNPSESLVRISRQKSDCAGRPSLCHQFCLKYLWTECPGTPSGWGYQFNGLRFQVLFWRSWLHWVISSSLHWETISSSKSEAMVPSWKRIEEFKFVHEWEGEIDKHTEVASAVMWTLYRSVVVKK